MYLKSIEVQGFKSFANKMTLEFHDGITGIVGPNGSGKSNVADAVRWVLGEQSAKQLRGSRMEDVIFAGTQLRKPQGYAYVAITLDNSDHKLPVEYDEVTVARRVYRSGESEYLMNGSNCRLKDVQELFFDTGIGKEGYSIIGQGQIDKILSGKPEERRELFDEAAGIVKYKKRKQTAQKQLEEERLNLSRITDILTEIEKQLGPLDAQQTAAKEFLRLKEELKHFEVNAFLLEQQRQSEQEAELSEKLEIVQGDLDGTDASYEGTKTEYERLERQTEELNEAISINAERKNEVMIELTKQESAIGLLNEQISSIQASDTHFRERKNVVLQECKEKMAELHKLQKEHSEVEANRFRLEDAKKEAEKLLEEIQEEIAGIENEIENRKEDVVRMLKQRGTLEADLLRYKTLHEQHQIKKSELAQRVLKNENAKTLAEQEVEAGKTKLAEISESISKMQERSRADEAKLTALREEGRKLREEYENCQRECIREQSRAESLRNISERYDGYGNGIRRVMEQKSRERGILGVVADIFQVDKSYETAIETALGGNIQNIVTDTEDTAKRMIEFLKQNKAGRVTFLPLDAIQAKNAGEEEKVKKEQGVIGYAAELVRTENRYKTVIQFLLGRIVVVDTVKNALALAKKYRYTLRIVTLEGEQLNPGGSISGGAYKNASNLLGRKREVEEAQERVEHLKERLASVDEKRSRVREEQESLNIRLAEEKEALQEEILQQNTAQLELDRILSAAKEHMASYEEIQQELLRLETQDAGLSVEMEKISESLRQNTGDSAHNEKCIEECGVELGEQKKKEQEQTALCERLRMEYGTIEQQEGFLSENISRLEKELEKLESEETKLSGEGDHALLAVAEKEEAIQTAQGMMESLQKTLEVLKEESKTLETNREKVTGAHKAVFEQRETLAKRKAELDKELFRLNDRLDKVKEQIEVQSAYMWEEYEITFSDAQKLKDEKINNAARAKGRIGELKNQIKQLGPVNVNAIEEYRECMERFTFLDGQRKDLVEAGETLTRMIADLDEKMRLQFTEQFALIKDRFAIVFAELFGGGKGTLALQEEEDILTAGISINAQPPGKKLQNMMQLSGGEKALTAIALLFAIQNLKPSPFCLLDEIEAALDDSNVKRYAGYLHKLTKDTQFIVITHRRGTMAAADTLYGITMQEKGVSTLVSVSLIEDELDA